MSPVTDRKSVTWSRCYILTVPLFHVHIDLCPFTEFNRIANVTKTCRNPDFKIFENFSELHVGQERWWRRSLFRRRNSFYHIQKFFIEVYQMYKSFLLKFWCSLNSSRICKPCLQRIKEFRVSRFTSSTRLERKRWDEFLRRAVSWLICRWFLEGLAHLEGFWTLLNSQDGSIWPGAGRRTSRGVE